MAVSELPGRWVTVLEKLNRLLAEHEFDEFGLTHPRSEK